MTLASRVDVRQSKSIKNADIVLGDDWIAPQTVSSSEVRAKRARRGLISINRSPLARKIVTFNLLALIILVSGVLYLNPFRDSLVAQREIGLVAEAELIADVMEALLPDDGAFSLITNDGLNTAKLLASLDLQKGAEVYVFDRNENIVATIVGKARAEQDQIEGLQHGGRKTIITDFLNSIFEGLSGLLAPSMLPVANFDSEKKLRSLIGGTLMGKTQVLTALDENGSTIFSVATPIMQNGRAVGAVAMSSAAGEIDALVLSEREQVLQMFVIAILVSIGLSLVLASTIANPLSDLAAAAEVGRDRNSRKVSPGRVRIPDLSARPDEIGRLSGALRGMVSALYDRIDANEQFAADVAHEIKNPLASLRSAVGTLRIAKRDDQRSRLLDVIEHDVRRLDRLVSDISNASRLDSELVKEEEETFDLTHMMTNINDYLGAEAKGKGIEFISDLPSHPIEIQGLEARLAQVFVNLISNAISFCEEGDAIRVWARKRENRVLVVVEDTGPGIPEQSLTKIFNRFYTSRPVGQFGDNSGLGLAISKQIVEAHGGVIWAENIRPTDADIMSEPLGARFVVGIPV
ncbi:MAG: sensor histidine kinase [Marinosulfonomonas sp.]|nr:sensor histidine kinase [Marinosulfonomonas sp.]